MEVMNQRCVKLMMLTIHLVRALVDEPGGISIWPGGTDPARLVRLHVQVAKDDVGKLIGKQGRMARALRLVLGAAAAQMGVRCELVIVEQERRVQHEGLDEGAEDGADTAVQDEP